MTIGNSVAECPRSSFISNLSKIDKFNSKEALAMILKSSRELGNRCPADVIFLFYLY